MGGFDVLGVDLDGLRDTITTLRGCADTLEQQSRRVGAHVFGIGNDEAGRNYSASGAAVQHGFEHIAACLHRWSTVTAATADVFDGAAADYARIDHERAAAVSGVHP
ncbi:hypothetical protein [Nocardia sp. NPDC006630]|uniref:hypothetical protein n=1 Tax=unclassified Nocardia TaxID=2637762 RepID=UPI003243F980